MHALACHNDTPAFAHDERQSRLQDIIPFVFESQVYF
jgi:hypothetical protein